MTNPSHELSRSLVLMMLMATALPGSWVVSQESTALPMDASTARSDYLAQRKNGLLQLNQRYVAKLNEIIAGYSKSGQLENALAVKAELTRIEEEIAELKGESPRAPVTPAAGPGSTPQPGTPFEVVIKASSEKGVSIDGLLPGDRIILQYQSGKWKSHGKLATENPDAEVLPGGDENRLGLFGRKAGVSRPVSLAVLPAGTAATPYEFLVPPDYREIFLRVNIDPDGEWKENPGEVVYRVMIAKPIR